jgi:hypothetical protein
VNSVGLLVVIKLCIWMAITPFLEWSLSVTSRASQTWGLCPPHPVPLLSPIWPETVVRDPGEPPCFLCSRHIHGPAKHLSSIILSWTGWLYRILDPMGESILLFWDSKVISKVRRLGGENGQFPYNRASNA